MSLFPASTVYLIDTSSVVRLDGKDGVPSALPFSKAEQEAIWKELENLADQGRLKLIKQVKEELSRHDPNGLKRLKQYPGQKLIIRRTASVIKHYQSITTQHPDLTKGGSRFDKADPWLIVAAEIHGYTIITEELLKKDRTTLVARRRNMERIPDVCKIRPGLNDAIGLRDLAKQEGWHGKDPNLALDKRKANADVMAAVVGYMTYDAPKGASQVVSFGEKRFEITVKPMERATP